MTVREFPLVATERTLGDGLTVAMQLSDVRIEGDLQAVADDILAAADLSTAAPDDRIGTLRIAETTIDGWTLHAAYRAQSMTDEPPLPPLSAGEGDQCRGRTAAGAVCELTYNWGRVDDPETNPGRCRYHKDQPLDADGDSTDPVDEPPFPPLSETEGDQCRGRTAAGQACELTFNWGRADPTENPGRCRYHADQTITPPESDDPDSDLPTAPCTIDAVSFVAAEDSDATRHDDSGVRPDSPVDIESPDLGGSGQGSIGFVREGEWTEYEFQAPAGTYEISLAVASDRDGELTVSVDGAVVGTVVRDTEGWYNFQEIPAGTITFDAEATHTLRVSAGALPLNYDRIRIEAVSGGTTGDGDRDQTGTFPAYGEGLYGEVVVGG
jgi:hypothetical protein